MPDLFQRAVEAQTANIVANAATAMNTAPAVMPNGSY
jgi:hypothetical protein